MLFRSDEDLRRLLSHLRGLYEMTVDLKGRRHLGIDTEYCPEKGTMRLSMDAYYRGALEKLGVVRKGTAPGTPMPYSPPVYGRTGPQMVSQDVSPTVSQERKTYLQQCIGTFLYPARWLDPLILTALSRLATRQVAPTERTMEELDHLLQYIAWRDRKSTRLNSSHKPISYAVFCLKKKKNNTTYHITH